MNIRVMLTLFICMMCPDRKNVSVLSSTTSTDDTTTTSISETTTTDTTTPETTTVALSVPGSVENVTISNESGSGFLLFWIQPQNPDATIEEYVISVSTGPVIFSNITIRCVDNNQTDDGDSEWSVSKMINRTCEKSMNYSVSGLLPLQNYTVTIAAINVAGTGEITSLNASTTDGENIMDVKDFTMTNRSETSLSFEWTSPKLLPALKNVNYTVKWSEDDTEYITAEENSTTISNLTSGQIYNFTLYFHLSDGVNIFTYQHEPALEERTNPKPPYVDVQNNNQTGSSLTVHLLKQGIVDHYNVTLKLDTETVEEKTSYDSQITFTELYGDTTYILEIVSVAGDLNSRLLTINFTTNETIADTPQNLTVAVLNATSVNISWSAPRLYPGSTDYLINVYEENHIDSNTYSLKLETVINGYNNTSYIFTNLLSYWKYRFSVTANTSVGSSESVNSTVIRTNESAPGKVQNFMVNEIPNNYTAITVSWACPKEKEWNGPLKGFIIEYKKKEEDVNTVNITETENCVKPYSRILDIIPEVNYTISVRAVTSYDGLDSALTFYTSPGKPPKLNEEVIISKPKPVPEKESSFTVNFCARCLTDKTNGIVTFTAMIICKTDICGTVNDPHSVQNWYSWQKNNYKGMYRPTPDNWLTDTSRTRTVRSVQTNYTTPDSFEVGTDADCWDKPNKTCNGPLDPGSKYSIKFVSCTTAGCTQSEFLDGFLTKASESSGTVGAVVGTLCAVIIIALAIGGIWYYKKRYGYSIRHGLCIKKTKETYITETSDLEDVTDHIRPVKMADFRKRLGELKANSNLLFTKEFADLQSKSPKKSSDIAKQEANHLKNRYINILAYDHSLVKLTPVDEDDNSLYINANFIPGYNSLREYIATQGPQDITINDFWRMIWERRVPIIVMLTAVKEGYKHKCAQYWPDEVNLTNEYGDILVTLDKLSTLSTYTVKTFSLYLGETKRSVKHFFMHDWRDYDANLNPKDVANFISDIRREINTSDTNPIVVHCSAGVGRTGTFIALDYLMQFIQNHDLQDTIDIFQFILKMRENRPHMVQSEKQYIFIHEAVNMMIEQKKLDEEGENDEQIYQNAGFEVSVPEDNIYANYENGKVKT